MYRKAVVPAQLRRKSLVHKIRQLTGGILDIFSAHLLSATMSVQISGLQHPKALILSYGLELVHSGAKDCEGSYRFGIPVRSSFSPVLLGPTKNHIDERYSSRELQL